MTTNLRVLERGILRVKYFLPKLTIKSLLFSLSVLLLPIQLGKHFWPQFSLVLGSRVDYLSPTLYLSDIFICLFIIISYWEEKIFFQPRVAIFLIFLSIGIYLSSSPLAGWYGLLKLTEMLLFGFAVRKFLSNKEGFSLLSVLFSISVICESVLAFLQFFLHRSIGGFFYFLGERSFSSTTPGIANVSVNGSLILRPYATFPHPNVLAGFLVISLIIIFEGLVFARKNKEKVFYISSLFLGTIALFISFSRIATILWLSLLIYFSIYLLTRKEFHKEITTVITLFSLICVFLLGAIGFPSVVAHVMTTSIAEESVVDRIILSSASIQMAKMHPFFGVGLLNFLQSLPNISPVTNLASLQPVHNIFLLMLAEGGFIGFGFACWFLIKTVAGLFSSYKKTKAQDRFSIVIAFFLISSIITLGLIDHYFMTLQQGQLLFSLVLGICWAKILPQNAKHK